MSQTRTEKYEEIQRLLSDPEMELEGPRCAHIIGTEPGVRGTSVVLEARITGTPVTALCGYVFVPERDPKKLPLCDVCKDIYETERIFNGGLNEEVAE